MCLIGHKHADLLKAIAVSKHKQIKIKSLLRLSCTVLRALVTMRSEQHFNKLEKLINI